MVAAWATTVAAIVLTVMLALVWGWKVLNWLWLRPKKLERLLREQGLQGTPYRLLVGDLKDIVKMQKEAKSKPMNISDDDLVPRVQPFFQQNVNKYGMPISSPFFLFANCLLYLPIHVLFYCPSCYFIIHMKTTSFFFSFYSKRKVSCHVNGEIFSMGTSCLRLAKLSIN